MKKTGLLMVALAGLALSACAPRYYDDRYGYRDHDRGYIGRDDRRDHDDRDRGDHYRDRGDNAYRDPVYQDGR